MRITGYHLALICTGKQQRPMDLSGLAIHSITKSTKKIGHKPIANWLAPAKPQIKVNKVSVKKVSIINLKKYLTVPIVYSAL